LMAGILFLIVYSYYTFSSVPCPGFGAICPTGWAAVLENAQSMFTYDLYGTVIGIAILVITPVIIGTVIGFFYGLARSRPVYIILGLLASAYILFGLSFAYCYTGVYVCSSFMIHVWGVQKIPIQYMLLILTLPTLVFIAVGWICALIHQKLSMRKISN